MYVNNSRSLHRCGWISRDCYIGCVVVMSEIPRSACGETSNWFMHEMKYDLTLVLIPITYLGVVECGGKYVVGKVRN